MNPWFFLSQNLAVTNASLTFLVRVSLPGR
jgi:hypothetical protein